ncbi:MAG: hypothetical protein JSS29_15755 [Proteobacteria bacterium]|nr:hypothetical protein [Pseudomonadota bacterium]
MTIKAYLILALVLLLAVAEGYLLWRVHRDGEQLIIAHDRAAVAQHDKDVAAQKALDEHNAQESIDDLTNQLNAMRSVADKLSADAATHPVRLCVAQRSDQGRPAGAAAAGAQPAEPPDGSGDPSVRSGTGAGPDIGPGMRDLALAGAILSTYRDRTVEWAMKQSELAKTR